MVGVDADGKEYEIGCSVGRRRRPDELVGGIFNFGGRQWARRDYRSQGGKRDNCELGLHLVFFFMAFAAKLVEMDMEKAGRRMIMRCSLLTRERSPFLYPPRLLQSAW